ncbi:MAG: GAF domain-containing protein, partial [Chloroflexota bacterium]
MNEDLHHQAKALLKNKTGFQTNHSLEKDDVEALQHQLKLYQAALLLQTEILEQTQQEAQDNLGRIQKAKQEWEATIDALPELVCLLDNQKRIIRANRTIEKWELAPVVEVHHQDLHHLLHPHCSLHNCYLQIFLNRAFPQLKEGKSTELEAEDKILGRYLYLHMQPISQQKKFGLTETDSFATITIQDITRQKLAEQSLYKSEAHYRTLFENSPNSIWDVDFSGVKTTLDDLQKSGVTDIRDHLESTPEIVRQCLHQITVLDINKTTLELYGVELKKQLLSELHNFFTLESLPTFQKLLIRLAKGETTYEGEIITRTVFGGQRFIDFTLFIPPDYQHNWSKVLVSMTDVSDRKLAENLMRSRQYIVQMLADFEETISRLDSNVVIQQALSFIRTRTGVYQASLALDQTNRNEFQIIVASGPQLTEESITFCTSRADPLLAKVIKTAKPFYEPHLTLEENGQADRAWLTPDLRAHYLVPLWQQDDYLGILHVGSPQSHSILEDTRQLLTLLTPRLALALQNARLYEQSWDSEQRFRRIFEDAPLGLALTDL